VPKIGSLFDLMIRSRRNYKIKITIESNNAPWYGFAVASLEEIPAEG